MPTAFFVIPPRKKKFSFPTVLGVQDWRVPSFLPNALQTLEGRFPFPAALFFKFFYPHHPRRTPLQLDIYAYLDPYNNTFGEENWLIILLVIFCCLYCTFGMFLAFGIILYEKYGLNPGNRQVVDMVR